VPQRLLLLFNGETRPKTESKRAACKAGLSSIEMAIETWDPPENRLAPPQTTRMFAWAEIGHTLSQGVATLRRGQHSRQG